MEIPQAPWRSFGRPRKKATDPLATVAKASHIYMAIICLSAFCLIAMISVEAHLARQHDRLGKLALLSAQGGLDSLMGPDGRRLLDLEKARPKTGENNKRNETMANDLKQPNRKGRRHGKVKPTNSSVVILQPSQLESFKLKEAKVANPPAVSTTPVSPPVQPVQGKKAKNPQRGKQMEGQSNLDKAAVETNKLNITISTLPSVPHGKRGKHWNLDKAAVETNKLNITISTLPPAPHGKRGKRVNDKIDVKDKLAIEIHQANLTVSTPAPLKEGRAEKKGKRGKGKELPPTQ